MRSIAQLVGHERFGSVILVAKHAQKWHVGANRLRHKEAPADFARRAHGARNGAPNGVRSVRGPQQPGSGLIFKTRVRVLLQLAAQDQAECVRRQSDFILDELADLIIALLDRHDALGERFQAGTVHVDVAIACPASDLLAVGQSEAILEVDVKSLRPFRV